MSGVIPIESFCTQRAGGGESPVRAAPGARYLLPTGMTCGQWQWSSNRPDEAVSGYHGPVKRSTLNSAVHPKSPDRVVEVRTCTKAPRGAGSDL